MDKERKGSELYETVRVEGEEREREKSKLQTYCKFLY